MKKILIILSFIFLSLIVTSCDKTLQFLDKSYVGGELYNINITFIEDGTCNIKSNKIEMYQGTFSYNSSDIIKAELLNTTGDLIGNIIFEKEDNKIKVVEISETLQVDINENLIFKIKVNDTFYENEYAELLVGAIPLTEYNTTSDELGFVNNRLLISSDEEYNIYKEKLNLQNNIFNKMSATLAQEYEIDFSKYDLIVYNTQVISQFYFDYISIRCVAANGNINLFGCIDYYIGSNILKNYIALYVVVEKGKFTINDIIDNIVYTNLEWPGAVAEKPIIYLYPEEDMQLSIKFLNENNLLTTYPKYRNAWNLFVKKDGTIYDETNRSYYALFYDEKMSNICTFEEGFYVTKDNAIAFLEDKLEILGFTEREANEFIMYWLPILESNEQSIVYFEQTEERNKNCPLNFSTTPDSMLRVIMHIKKVENYVNIKEQQLFRFERKGFCLVEWGGTTYN